ncbi:carboxyl-terminal-processing peptidase 1, chloroplastic [Canna indica]|uniref:C-terminal processing peptidase n=1 Tax=Canna indica TaxID=4628 RepID=A0AAQ3KTQ4_9LILI|nr:carboxyl-terminal-processing peptidase 1, chloroplastic [Canna indica]
MRSISCSLPLSPPPPLTTPSRTPSLSSIVSSANHILRIKNHKRHFDDDGSDISRCLQNILLQAVAGSLSLSLVALPPPSAAAALQSPAPVELTPPSPDLCRDEEGEMAFADVPPESITNEGLVEEAWEVVNESFLPDAGKRSWSSEKWMQKKENFLYSKIQTRSRAHDVIKKMLASLGDPYTRFLSPAEFSKMAKYDVTGIGLNLREVPDDEGSVKLKVLGIVLDGPAYSAGVRRGDEILSVNGVNVRGMSAFDVSSLLQGPNETFVTIEVKHGNCGTIQSLKVERQLVARSPIFYRLEKLDTENISVGYIHIKEFNALAKKDLVIALRRLQDAGATCFILDLKDNLGGLVQAGIEVAKLFLNKGETVIHTVGRDPEVQKSIVAENAPLIASPLIVLVNNRTASASEIVATALHDNCKAVLVGERTFGKGLIQSVYELQDGSGVVVTIGKYVTPNHKDINGNGVQPDFTRIPALNEVTNYLSQCSIESKS